MSTPAPMDTDASPEQARQRMKAALTALLPRLLAALWPDAAAPAAPQPDEAAPAAPPSAVITHVRRLSAGATLHTWAFDVECPALSRQAGLILRGAPQQARSADTLPLDTEAALLLALGHGTPALSRWAPQVVLTLQPAEGFDGLHQGFVMRRIAGETIARKIQRDPAFADARAGLVSQLGQALGAIHQAADPARQPITARQLAALPQTLPASDAAQALQRLRQRVQALARPSPVLAWAARWLGQHLPAQPAPGAWAAQPVLVHGDYRLGNVIVDGQGLAGVLDWELAHLGDPAQDIGWLCLPPWRFGQIQQPVAGLGRLDELLLAYEQATGWTVDRPRVRWWQAAGSLWWGLACAQMHQAFASGADPTVERAMIARRVSENELDLLRLLAPRRTDCPA